MNRTAVVYALVSAALFGVSTPAAKALVGAIDPIILAGLLYCGAGIGVTILRRIAHAVVAPGARGANPFGDRTSHGWQGRLPLGVSRDPSC
jgi:hypothetical protein